MRARWLRRLWRRSARERDRAAEMRAHLDLYTDELIGRGLSAEEAAREGRLRFGNPRAKLEEVSDMNHLPLFDALWHDARHAVRALRSTPAFTLTAMATLALVIGANTAVFSLADTLLLRPLPYPGPDRLAMLIFTQRGGGEDFTSHWADGAMWEATRDRVPSLDTAVMGSGGGANLFVNGTAMYIQQQRVSAGFSRVLGVPPARGAWFTEADDRPGGPAVAVLSYGLWQRAFAGAPDIVGQRILLKGEPHVVVGVMPQSFLSTMPADLWTPLRPSSSGEGGGTNYMVIARVKQVSSWAQAEGELHATETDAFRLLKQDAGVTRTLGLESMQEAFASDVRQPIALLGSVVAAVLLIACVNLAGLMLARGSSRSTEIATRMALGGGRAVVVRQLMMEALILALAGGLAGVFVGTAALEALKTLGGERFDEWTRATINARVLATALGLSVITSVVFGLAPALQATRLDITRALAQGGSRTIAGRSSVWPRRVLVVVEVALGVVLLVATGLLVRTFVNVRSLDPGFEPAGLITASVSLQDARYRDAASVNRLFDDSLRRLAATPGVESAAISLQLPYDRLLNSGFQFMDDAAAEAQTTNASYVTPSFLPTLRMKVTQGRGLSDADRAGSAPVVLVNETFARVYSPGRPVLGRRIRIGGGEREIAGVTADVRQRQSFRVAGVTPGPLVALPLVLIPAAQASDGFFRTAHTWFSPAWTVRARDEGVAARALSQAIAAADPQLPISRIRSMTDVISDATTAQRLMMMLVATLAGAAVLLAAIGVYGLVAHSVAERRREFGIRIALGATAGGAVRRVTLGGVVLVAYGAVAGVLLSMPATSLLRSFLWQVDPTDPLTYASVGLVLLVVSCVASVIPALRLLHLNPADTLRM